MAADIIGQRGEAIFYVRITKPHPGRGPLFRAQFLGDKWPLVDYIVELEGVEGTTPFFLVQIKTTSAGMTTKERRLKVKVSKEDIDRLAAYPAPTYIIGIDEPREEGYIVSANGENSGSLSSLNTSFPIDSTSREKLWDEVKNYWMSRGLPKLISAFSDPNWK